MDNENFKKIYESDFNNRSYEELRRRMNLEWKLKTFTSILPLGMVNIKTGKSKYFNIYDEWLDNTGKTTAEFWKIGPSDGRMAEQTVVIFTSGSKPLFGIGAKRPFMHDQTMNRLFSAECIDSCPLEELKDHLEYGTSLRGYVYK